MKDFHIRPLAGYIICKPHLQPKIGDMQAADTISSQDSTGEVVAVGEDWIYYVGSQSIVVKCPVKVGDKIAYPNMGVHMIRDFKTGDLLYMPRFHCDAMFTQILSILE